MNKDDFDQMVMRLKKGDNQALAALSGFQRDCMRMLELKTNRRCQRDDAYDIFVDSVLDFRKNVINDQVVFGNIKAYFLRICWNKWLSESRSRKRKHEKNHEYSYVMNEEIWNEKDGDEKGKAEKLHSLQIAMKAIGERCSRILKMAIVDRIAMKEIAKILGLANADVAKTIKSRCNKKLMMELRKMQAI
jgi:DNA-directed RNA polymerase specialized sigma24 family protein